MGGRRIELGRHAGALDTSNRPRPHHARRVASRIAGRIVEEPLDEIGIGFDRSHGRTADCPAASGHGECCEWTNKHPPIGTSGTLRT